MKRFKKTENIVDLMRMNFLASDMESRLKK